MSKEAMNEKLEELDKYTDWLLTISGEMKNKAQELGKQLKNQLDQALNTNNKMDETKHLMQKVTDLLKDMNNVPLTKHWLYSSLLIIIFLVITFAVLFGWKPA